MFEKVIGQPVATRLLEGSLKEDKLSPAYLFVGPEGTGRLHLARELAKMLNCLGQRKSECQCQNCVKIEKGIHLDVRVIQSEKTTIGIEEIRELQNLFHLKPRAGKWKVAIIAEANKLTPEGENSLLKILEEPPPNTLLILIARTTKELFPTVVSRCQIIRFKPLAREEIIKYLQKEKKMNFEESSLRAAFSEGSLEKALSFGETFFKKREEWHQKFIALIDSFQGFEEVLETAENFGRPEVEELLWFALLCYRDLVFLRVFKNTQFVLNVDKINQIQHLGKTTPIEKLIRNIEILKLILERLTLNINPRLALENAFLEIRTKEDV
jgi:DNA polymerase-3 subunit delta'